MRMVQYSVACFVVLATILIQDATAQKSGGLISRTVARRLGLERSWFTQIELDSSRSKIAYITQDHDTLFVQTDAGVLHALNANNGSTLWASQIGRPEYPTLAPAASLEYVAVVNGSTLYVIDRTTGRTLWSRKLGGGPGAGPAISAEHVFVPLINGRVEAYNLKVPETPPWIYSSAGRAMVQPVSTDRSVAWPTDRGFLFVAQTGDQLAIRYRVETNDAITSKAVYKKPYFYASSLDGNVYAFHEMSGEQIWRFSAGDPIEEPATVIDDRIYVPTDHAGMYCVDANTGREVWWAPRIERFLAASKERVYATDNLYQLYILDGKTGGRLATLPIYGMDMLLVNQTTDRLYLASNSGLIQCLHDASLEKPIYHNVVQEETPEDPSQPVTEAPAEGEPDEKPVDPFAVPEEKPAPKKPEADPFGGGADPFGGGGGAEDPFGAPAENPAPEKEPPAKAEDDPFSF